MSIKIKKIYSKIIFINLIALYFTLNSCGIYSFTGASYGNAKSVSIDFFENYASYVQPTLSQVFTEKMKDRFVSQTPLALVSDEGDLKFSGSITDYQVTPVGIQAGETAASNRLTIIINVKFVNETDPDASFEKSFSRYADFDISQSLNSVETGLIDEITDLLIDDIFNDSVVNW